MKIYFIVIQVFSVLLSLLNVKLLFNFMGPVEFGFYSLSQFTAAIFLMPSESGIALFLIKDSLRNRHNFQLFFFHVLLISVIALVFSLVNIDTWNALILFYLYLPIAYFYSYEKLRINEIQSQLIFHLIRPLLILLAFSIFVKVLNVNFYTALLMLSIGFNVLMILHYIFILRAPKLEAISLKNLFQSYLLASSAIVNNIIDLLLSTFLRNIGDISYVGFYRISKMIFSFALTPFSALSSLRLNQIKQNQYRKDVAISDKYFLYILNVISVLIYYYVGNTIIVNYLEVDGSVLLPLGLAMILEVFIYISFGFTGNFVLLKESPTFILKSQIFALLLWLFVFCFLRQFSSLYVILVLRCIHALCWNILYAKRIREK